MQQFVIITTGKRGGIDIFTGYMPVLLLSSQVTRSLPHLQWIEQWLIGLKIAHSNHSLSNQKEPNLEARSLSTDLHSHLQNRLSNFCCVVFLAFLFYNLCWIYPKIKYIFVNLMTMTGIMHATRCDNRYLVLYLLLYLVVCTSCSLCCFAVAPVKYGFVVLYCTVYKWMTIKSLFIW